MLDVKIINGYSVNDEKSRTNIGCSADTYDKSKTYAVGDIVVYKTVIYKCITAITTAEDFDSSKWQQICLRDLIIELKEKTEIVDLTETFPIIPMDGSEDFSGTMVCRKFGKVVTVYCNGTIKAGYHGIIKVDGAIPEKFWPYQKVGVGFVNDQSYISIQNTGFCLGYANNYEGTEDVKFLCSETYIAN